MEGTGTRSRCGIGGGLFTTLEMCLSDFHYKLIYGRKLGRNHCFISSVEITANFVATFLSQIPFFGLAVHFHTAEMKSK